MFKLIHATEDSAGLSLIEVVIASLIVSISVMGSYTLFAGIKDSSVGNSTVMQTQQEARIAVERMARELRESSTDRMWTHEDIDFYEPMIIFLTPRDEDRTFVVDESGDPDWQRAVLYRLDIYLNRVYRYESYEPYIVSTLAADSVNPFEIYELVYEMQWYAQPEELCGNNAVNIVGLDFSRDNDTLFISMRTAPDRGEGGEDGSDPYMDTNTAKSYTNVADAYTHLSTTVRLRN